MPYGDKSTAAIQAYAVKIAHMLLQKQCKLILIACYSATAAAYELVKEYIGSKALTVNVIDPVIIHLKNNYKDKRIGLIGTRQTVNSKIFLKKIENIKSNIAFSSCATNLLAQAIEEFGNHDILDPLLKVYLSHPALQQIDALILACTHYPIIKDRIFDFYQKNIEVIDSSEIVADHVKQILKKHNLLNDNGNSAKHFYVSDYTDSFAANARLFFGDELKLEHYPMWD
jgi:glutamate racemase